MNSNNSTVKRWLMSHINIPAEAGDKKGILLSLEKLTRAGSEINHWPTYFTLSCTVICLITNQTAVLSSQNMLSIYFSSILIKYLYFLCSKCYWRRALLHCQGGCEETFQSWLKLPAKHIPALWTNNILCSTYLIGNLQNLHYTF